MFSKRKEAPRNKATGEDGVFGEAMAVSEKSGALIMVLWRTVGRTACVPMQKRRVVMAPLHKSGSKADPRIAGP